MPTLFEWDRRKAEANLRKHEVSFEEAQTVFTDLINARQASARERKQYEEETYG